MQWTDGPNAGFSEGAGELYLPVHENYAQVNVQAQQQEEGSLLRTVQELVAVKRAYPGQVLSSANVQVADGKVRLGPVSYLWFQNILK